jgi:hypothetical protein
VNAVVRAWIERVTSEPWKLYADRERAEIDMVCEFNADNTFAHDCGGWREDPPCGGCDRCLSMQISYYVQRERDEAVTYARAGFAFLPQVEIPWQGVRSHDPYDCAAAGER